MNHRLRIEPLEDRCLPAQFGYPWLDPQHLTLSFAPDGTPAGGQSNRLTSFLNGQPGLAGTDWQRVILQAFQTWAAVANFNISVRSDSGDPFGTPGAPQGDSRFGDVRVGAVALDPTQIAQAQPFDVAAGTWSGDLFLDTTDAFGTGQAGTYDLFTVALHEAGHVLGLPDSTVPASVMSETYQGVRTGLSFADVAAIQALYGPRQADASEGNKGNDTSANATNLPVDGGSSVAVRSSLAGDITTAADVDYYTFRWKPQFGNLTVQVQTSGLSSLLDRLTVYNNSMQVVASAVALDPRHGDLSLGLGSVSANTTYYLKVEGAAGSAFGIGAYQLRLVSGTPPSGPAPAPAASLINVDNHSDDDLRHAQSLTPRTALPDGRFDYAYPASISDTQDIDCYQFRAPHDLPAGTHPALTVMVWGLSAGGLDPRVTLYDNSGQALPAAVLVHENGTFVLQLANAVRDARYRVAVAAADPTGASAVGNYFLGIDFAPVADSLTPSVSGALAAATDGSGSWTSQPAAALTVKQGQLFHLVLSGQAAAAPTGVVQLTLFDANGQVVATLTVGAGQTQSLTLWLAAGTYTLRFSGVGPAAPGTAPLNYTLALDGLSDPIEPYPIDPTDPSATPPASGPPPILPPVLLPDPIVAAYSLSLLF